MNSAICRTVSPAIHDLRNGDDHTPRVLQHSIRSSEPQRWVSPGFLTTRVTTKSPAGISQTAIPAFSVSSVKRFPSTSMANGACSIPSSMAITSPGRFSRIPWQSMETDKKTNEYYRSVLMNARGSSIRSRLGGANRYTWEMSHCTLCTRSVQTCIWRIDMRADTTDKSRREREMPLPF